MADDHESKTPSAPERSTTGPKSTGEARKRKAWTDEESLACEGPAKARFPRWSSEEPSQATLEPAPMRKGACPYMAHADLDGKVGGDTAEMVEHMKESENRFRTFDPNIRFLKFRRIIVDWLSEAGEHFGLHTSTVHVAIMLMDRIHNSILVSRRQVQLVAMACLIIAAKYEEAEQHVPTAADLNQYASYPYSREDIYNSEAYLLTVLDWKLTEIVPLHYIGFFMAKGVLFEDDMVDNRPLVEKVPRYLMKYHVFFSELCMQEYGFQAYPASVVACAIVAASRQALKIRPVWREELTKVTGCTFADCEACFNELWSYFEESFPEAAANAKQLSPATIVAGAVARHA